MLERKQTLVAVISIFVIIASFLLMWLPHQRRPPTIRLEPFEAAGEMAAEEIARLLGAKGQNVIVAFDPGKVRMPSANVAASALNAELQGFNNAIKKQGNLTVVATETVEVLHLGAFYPDSGLAAEKYFELMEKYPSVDAIVSVAGVPLLREEDFEKLGAKFPKFIAVSSFGGGPIQKVLAAHAVQAVIAPRWQTPDQSATKPKSRRDWFDKHYEVLTAESVPASQ